MGGGRMLLKQWKGILAMGMGWCVVGFIGSAQAQAADAGGESLGRSRSGWRPGTSQIFPDSLKL